MSSINNHVLRSLRFTLALNDTQMAELFALANPATSIDARGVEAMLRRDEEAEFMPCSGSDLSDFLDGLISKRRGPNPNAPPRQANPTIDNNAILKKLRVAFELKDVDMHAIFDSVQFAVTKPEISAFFRQPGHRNFRPCGDQILRQFLKGLARRVRG